MFENEEGGHDKYRKLPLFKKAREIYEISEKIVDLIPEEDEMMSEYRGWMMECASIMGVKIAGAEGAGLYDLRMENACLIRKAARELQTICSGLKMMDFKDAHYLPLLREAIEEFRLLFVDWVASFDQWDYVIDRWGLFNPPGVGPHDIDPDDDIPFNPGDLLD